MTEPIYEVVTCGHCPARIIWAQTATGKWMPVDSEPSVDGNVALSVRHDGMPLAAVLGVAARFGRTNLRVSHFVTCPKAALLRRSGRPS